jgi:ABC-type proline/glycine betaine transport system substrate-binding protein
MSATIPSRPPRRSVRALRPVAAVLFAAGCAHDANFVSIGTPTMTPNPATIGTKSLINVVLINKVGCTVASIKVTYGATVVSTQSVNIGQAYIDSVTVTGTGPVKAEGSCGDAINTQVAILTGI